MSRPDDDGSARRHDSLAALEAVAALVRGVRAGAVLHRSGAVRPFPGLDVHLLLGRGSPVLAVARALVEGGGVVRSFLWPQVQPDAPYAMVRVTTIAGPHDDPDLLGAVVLSPVGDLRGLTRRELQVLGLLQLGCSNDEIARALAVTARTVAAHVGHILVKLDAPTRTLAAVRSERLGLYLPVEVLEEADPAGEEQAS
jgi:DNA-binding CsgD family transcriptional regulator